MAIRELYELVKNYAQGYVDFNAVNNKKLKNNFLQAIPFWIASMLTGLIAVFYAKLFSFAERLSVYLFEHFKWYYLVIAPICFILSWLVVKKFAPFAVGSGIPQVMATLQISGKASENYIKKLLSLRIIIIKIVSSILMAIGGATIGREGPTIQIAGSIFHKIHSLLPSWWPKGANKNMIMAGAGAGLAAAFNTPLGGIVFVVEELTKTHINLFKTALFSAVIIAGLTAQTIFGPYLFLGFPNTFNEEGIFLYIPLLITTIVTGVLGSLMCKIILKVTSWKFRLKSDVKRGFYLAMGSIAIILVAIFLSEGILGSGKENMNELLFSDEKRIDWYSPFLKMGAAVVSFTSGAAGGVFAPSLSIGASLGTLVADLFNLSNGSANILILTGMVAFLTGVTRTPFTSAILVLEMTDRHNLIFQLMLASIIASLVALLVDRKSLYDHLRDRYQESLKK